MAGSGIQYFKTGNSGSGGGTPVDPNLLGKLIPYTIEVGIPDVIDSANNYTPTQTNTLFRVGYGIGGSSQIIFHLPYPNSTFTNGDWIAVEDRFGTGIQIYPVYPNPTELQVLGGGGSDTAGTTAYFHLNGGNWRLVSITKKDAKVYIQEGTQAQRLAYATPFEGLLWEEKLSGVYQDLWVWKNGAWGKVVDTQSTVVAGDLRPVNSVAIEAYISSKNNKTIIVDKLNGNDLTAVKYSTTLVYQSIKAAVLASVYGDNIVVKNNNAVTNYATVGGETIFTENDIPIINGTTIYLEDGVVVQSSDSYYGGLLIPKRGNIFSNTASGSSTEKTITWKLLGKGRILSNGETSNDTTGINFRYHNSGLKTADIQIEAKEITTWSVWGNNSSNVNIKFTNTLFKDGMCAPYGTSLGAPRCQVTYINCVFENTIIGSSRENGGLSLGMNRTDYVNCIFNRTLAVLPIQQLYTTSGGVYLFAGNLWGYNIVYKNLDTIPSTDFEGFNGASHYFKKCSFYNSIGGNGITLRNANSGGSMPGCRADFHDCIFFQNDASKYAIVYTGQNNGATGVNAWSIYASNNISNSTPILEVAPSYYINQLGGGNGFIQINDFSSILTQSITYANYQQAPSSQAVFLALKNRGLVKAYDAFPVNGGTFVADKYNTVVVSSADPVIIRLPNYNTENLSMIIEVRRNSSPIYGGSINVQVQDAYNSNILATYTTEGKRLFTYNPNTGNQEEISSGVVNNATQSALDAISKKGTQAQRLVYPNPPEGMVWEEVDGSGILLTTYKYKNGTWKLATQPSVACYSTIPRCDTIAAQAPVAGTIYFENIKVAQDVLVARLGVFVAALNLSDTWYLDVFKASDRSWLCGGTIVPNVSNDVVSCAVTPTQLSANTEYLFTVRSVNGAGSFGYRAGYATSSTRLSGVVTGVTGATPANLAAGSGGSVCAYIEYATS